MSPEASTLLVVDDNEDNRYTLTQRLKRQGYADVVTARVYAPRSRGHSGSISGSQRSPARRRRMFSGDLL